MGRRLHLRPKGERLGLLRLALLVLTLSSTVGVLFCLGIIDLTIHQTLYRYGLQFSLEWANPYWSVKWVILALLCVIATGSVGMHLSTLALKRERMKSNPGIRSDRSVGFGLAMAFFGVPFTAFSYWVFSSVPLTALGLACVILGVTVVLTPSSPVPKLAIRAMVEGSCVNVEALLEEINATERAFYLPPKEGRVYAFVPLGSNPHLSDAGEVMRAPMRVITKVGGSPGLLIFPLGSELIRLSGLSSGSGLEDALRHVLVDFVEAVESVKAVREGDLVVVDLVKPRVGTDFPRFRRVLGSLVTSIAGCVLASCLEVPVVFDEEEADKRRIRAVFRVLSWYGQA